MIFDGHADIWTHVAKKRQEQSETDIFRKYHYDNFKAGDVTGGIFAIWIDKEFMDRPKLRYAQIVESMNEELLDSADILNVVKAYGDFEAGRSAGKINVIIGAEGLSHIAGDAELLGEYYNKAHIRHASLTWNDVNELATCWKGDTNRGLTDAGKQVVKKMELLGMLLDVSHLNDASFWDIASVAGEPFVASHSNARAVLDHPRNLDDRQIKMVAESGGLVGMNSYCELVHENRDRQTVRGLCDHICHIAELVGTEHIGLGFDFMYYFEADYYKDYQYDSGSASLKDLGYVGEAPSLIGELRNRGFRQGEIDDICYNNYMRIFKRILKPV